MTVGSLAAIAASFYDLVRIQAELVHFSTGARVHTAGAGGRIGGIRRALDR